MSIIKDALQSVKDKFESTLESIETSVAEPSVAIPVTPAAALQAKLKHGEKHSKLTGTELKAEPTVLMNGPLSTVFTRALRIAYAKTDSNTDQVAAVLPETTSVNPTPGEAALLTTGGPSDADLGSFGDGAAMEALAHEAALESQSNDYINAAMAQRERQSSFPQSGVPQGSEDKTVGSKLEDVNTTISGLKPVPITKDEAIAIFKEPIDPLGVDTFDVVFYTDATVPTADSPMGEKPGSISMINVGQNSKNWRTSIESLIEELPSSTAIESISIHVKTRSIPSKA